MNTRNKYFIMTIVLLSWGSWIPGEGQPALISPVADVYVITFGGGEGGNPFLKYDITSVPAGQIIDSVFLTAYVWQVNPNWDGDVNYWNVAGQAWLETDSSRLIWNLPTSQLTTQGSGFGTAVGWAKSVDIGSIFLVDYNASNTYCSIKMKDPDDPTFNPMPGSYPKDPDDTVSLGNRSSNQHILFYPHEYANAPPWLVVHYHSAGSAAETAGSGAGIVTISPNPCRNATRIGVGIRAEDIGFRIYDIFGRLIYASSTNSIPCFHPFALCWNGADCMGNPVPAGVYFFEVTVDGRLSRHKVILTR